MNVLLLVSILFNPVYRQAELVWTQQSDAPTVLIGKWSAANVWSVIRVNDMSHAGIQRAIDYDPHDGDRYVVSECRAADQTINTCATVAERTLSIPPPFYLPLVL